MREGEIEGERVKECREGKRGINIKGEKETDIKRGREIDIKRGREIDR